MEPISFSLALKIPILNLTGRLFNFLLKKDVIVSPKAQLVKPRKINDPEIRYVIFIVNKRQRPFYSLVIEVETKRKVEMHIDPRLGEKFDPNRPLAIADDGKGPVVEFGNISIYNRNKNGSFIKHMIDNIGPQDKIKLEVVVKKIDFLERFTLRHRITYSKVAEPLTVKTEHKENTQSITIEGFNWNLKNKK